MSNRNHQRRDSIVWVLIADEAIARILLWPGAGKELQPVEELTDPDAHAKASAFRNDAYGQRSRHDGAWSGRWLGHAGAGRRQHGRAGRR